MMAHNPFSQLSRFIGTVMPRGALAIMMWVSFLAGTQAWGQNLVANPSFEQGIETPTNWTLWAPNGAVLTRDSSVRHNGQASVRITCEAAAAAQTPAFRFMIVSATPGQQLRGTVWARTDSIAGPGGAITLEFFNNETRLSAVTGDTTGAGSAGWRCLSVQATVPAQANRIGFVLAASGAGQVWFDDAVLSPNLLVNASFESGTTSPQSWEVNNYSPDGTVMQRVTDVAHGGQASVIIQNSPLNNGDKEYCSYKFLRVGVVPGQAFFARVWAKTENFTDIGGYTVIEYDHGDTRLDFATGEFTGPGTSDWKVLTVQGTVPQGADGIRLGLVAHGTGKVWFDDAELFLTDEPPPAWSGKQADLTLRTDQTIRDNFLGFGNHGDYFLTCSFNTSGGVDEADRTLVRQRVAAMRPAIRRVLFSYKWWEPVEGMKSPTSETMRDLVGWCRFLKSIDCAVLVNPWGDYFAYSDWMKPQGTRLPAPDKRDAMVRSLTDLLEYLIRDQGLTNVKYICLMNEPDNDPSRPIPVDEFVRLNRLLDQKLRERGLRDRLSLVGVDGSGWYNAKPGEWFYDVVSRGLDYADGCSAHTYGHKNLAPLPDWIHSRQDVIRANTSMSQPPRPLMINEFNTYGDTFSNPDNDFYWHGLFLADFAVTALREGVSNVLMWCLFDTYYDARNRQRYGLWKYKDEGWAPRPGFYSWSLITRYTRPGSRVIPVEVSPPTATQLKAVALISPAGQLSVLLINDYDQTLQLTLASGLPAARNLRLFQYTASAVTSATGAMFGSSAEVVIPASGQASFAMPARSFFLLSDVPEQLSSGSANRWASYK